MFSHSEDQALDLYEREVIRKASMLQEPITLDWTMEILGKGERKARECLLSLKEKGWLFPAKGGQQRIHAYVVNREKGWRK